jgi:hypothetical protein
MTPVSPVVDLARGILQQLASGPLTRSPLRRALKPESIADFDAALEELLASGKITSEPTKQGSGTRYIIAPAKTAAVQHKPCTRCGLQRRRPGALWCSRCPERPPDA